MAAVYSQYQRIGTNETAAGSPLTVRMAQDMASSLNGYKRYTAKFKVRTYLGAVPLASTYGHGKEHCVAHFAPVYVPHGYNALQVVIGHQLDNATGNVVWRVYSLRELYTNSVNMNASLLSYAYAVGNATSSNEAHNIATLKTNGIVQQPTGETWLVVTAQSTDNTSNAKLTTIDAWPTLE